MKLTHRLICLAAAALFAMAALGAFALYSLKSTLLMERRAQIVNLLTMADTLVKQYQAMEAEGRLSHDQAQAAAKLALTHLNNEGKSYFWVREPAGLNLVHPNPKVVGTLAKGQTLDGRGDAEAYTDALAKDRFGLVYLVVKRPSDGVMAPKLNGVVASPAWNWWIGTGFFNDDIEAAFWRSAWAFLGIFAAALVVMVTLAWRMSRGIIASLGGEPAYAAQVTERIAQGDLTGQVVLAATDRHSLLHAIAQMQRQLMRTVNEIRQGAQAIRIGTREIAAGNSDLSQRTEEQASALQQTAASMEQLTATVQHNADNARAARQLAVDASQVAQEGNTMFTRLVANMHGISDSSQRINDIIGVIDGIAFQTNILALNAAVEAARAGEQGRGFAVVAAEVRTLAQRSAAAAKEIKTLITDSTEQVDGGRALVDDASRTMATLFASVQRVAGIVEEISAASGEQSNGLGQISTAVQEMDRVTQQNAALVEQAAAAAMSLENQAQRLNEAVSTFRVDETVLQPA